MKEKFQEALTSEAIKLYDKAFNDGYAQGIEDAAKLLKNWTDRIQGLSEFHNQMIPHIHHKINDIKELSRGSR